VPEFKWNGSENVGMILFRDSFLRPVEEKSFFEYY
jgi:hypothetical protein